MDAEAIPLFPLESVVLFPTARVPLHVFESRYCAMTRDALEGDRRIGMVAVRPEHTAAMAGNPPLFGVGCEGVIREARELPDGRFYLLLEGLHRFRIQREREQPPSEGRLYRVAEVERLADPYPAADRAAVRALRQQVMAVLTDLVRRAAPSRSEALRASFAGMEDVAFVNALAQSIDFAPVEKQGLLESQSVLERLERLHDLIRFQLLEDTNGAPGPRETLH